MNGDPSNGDKNVTGPSIMALSDNRDIMVVPETLSGKGRGPPPGMLSRQRPGCLGPPALAWSVILLCRVQGPERFKGSPSCLPPPLPATKAWMSGVPVEGLPEPHPGEAAGPPACCVTPGQVLPPLGPTGNNRNNKNSNYYYC